MAVIVIVWEFRLRVLDLDFAFALRLRTQDNILETFDSGLSINYHMNEIQKCLSPIVNVLNFFEINLTTLMSTITFVQISFLNLRVQI